MGFEPMEHICPSDFKTDALSHSATLPYGAGEGGRTRNLLITNQLLCQLSYTSMLETNGDPEGARTPDLQRDRLAF